MDNSSKNAGEMIESSPSSSTGLGRLSSLESSLKLSPVPPLCKQTLFNVAQFLCPNATNEAQKILLKKNIPNGVSLVEYILQKLALKWLVSRFGSECTNVSGLTGGGCDFELCVSGLFPTSLKAF